MAFEFIIRENAPRSNSNQKYLFFKVAGSCLLIGTLALCLPSSAFSISLFSKPEIRIRTHATPPKITLDVFHPKLITRGVISEPANNPIMLFPNAEKVASTVESFLSCVINGNIAVLEIP